MLQKKIVHNLIKTYFILFHCRKKPGLWSHMLCNGCYRSKFALRLWSTIVHCASTIITFSHQKILNIIKLNRTVG